MFSRVSKNTPFLTKGYIWVNATATYNYMLNDPVIDWFAKHLSPRWNYKSKNIDYHSKKRNIDTKRVLPKDLIKNKPNKNAFLTHIMELGIEFECKVFECIKKRFTEKRVCMIHTDAKKPDTWQTCYNNTKSAMQDGYPFIFGGIVKSNKNHLYGITDLLVRSDWLHLLSKSTTKYEDAHSSACELNNNKIKYHYVVVDIKYTTLSLRADNIHILNTGSFPAYKSQLCIYNTCLGEMQGYTPKKSFLLGRRCKSVSKSKQKISKHCFDLLGTVDFSLIDFFVIKKTNDAIQWIRDLQSEESKGWNVSEYPLERWELYPNMCNKNDYPWTEIKKELATKNKELTMLWNIGPKKRNFAIKQGCYHWGGKECTTKKLNVNGKKSAPILSAILNINKTSSHSKINPTVLSNTHLEWLNALAIEFFVDFEVTDGSLLPIEKITQPNTEKYLNFIGVGFFDQKNNWIYRSFSMTDLTRMEEWKCISSFYQYISDLSRKTLNKTEPIRCYHWSKAEQWMWGQAVERHKNSAPLSKRNKIKKWTQLQWVDMLDIFKNEPIVLKGCLSFKLKDVAKKMYEYGYIKTTWKEDNACSNGLEAMINMIELYKKGNTNKNYIKLQDDLQDYNEVDVKVLAEILQFLRLKYAQKNPSKKECKKRKATTQEICTPEETSSISFRRTKRVCRG